MFQDVRPDESGDQERGWESRLRRESESHPLTPPSWRDRRVGLSRKTLLPYNASHRGMDTTVTSLP